MKSILSLSLILAGNVVGIFRIAMPGSISLVHQLLDQDCVIAETFGIDHDAVAEAFIRIGASILILVRAHPVRAAVLTGIALPAGLAEAVVLEQKETTVVYRVQCGPLILWDDFWRIGYC